MRLIGFAFTDSALDALDDLQPKIRKQVIKKAKALHSDPFPQGCKKLVGVETDDGDAVYRVRSGDYRILYIVRSKPEEIIVIDIDACMIAAQNRNFWQAKVEEARGALHKAVRDEALARGRL